MWVVMFTVSRMEGPMSLGCPHCSVDNPASNRFCGQCHMLLPPGGGARPSADEGNPYVEAGPSWTEFPAAPQPRWAAPTAGYAITATALPPYAAATRGSISVVYAGFWRRLGAYIVDRAVTGAMSYALFFVFFAANVRTAGDLAQSDGDGRAAWYLSWSMGLDMLLVLSVLPLYYILFWSLSGATFGCRLACIRVIRTDGGGLSLSRATLRFFGQIVSVVPLVLIAIAVGGRALPAAALVIGFLCIPLSWLWMIWDPRKQAWHDKLADTLVIRE